MTKDYLLQNKFCSTKISSEYIDYTMQQHNYKQRIQLNIYYTMHLHLTTKFFICSSELLNLLHAFNNWKNYSTKIQLISSTS